MVGCTPGFRLLEQRRNPSLLRLHKSFGNQCEWPSARRPRITRAMCTAVARSAASARASPTARPGTDIETAPTAMPLTRIGAAVHASPSIPATGRRLRPTPHPPHPRPRVDSHSCGRESVCSAVDVVTGNTLPRAMSALSYQLVTVTNCAAAVALCVATARDGCHSTNLRRPNNGRKRNSSFPSRPAQRRSILRWRMLATNIAQPINRPSDGSTTPLRAGEEQNGAAVSGTPA